MNPYLTLQEALALRIGKKLVFTNGVFDVIHAGHIASLRQARELGDLLLVGMNTDSSVRSLGKGDDRPIHTLEDRAQVLTAIRYVDGVIPFEEADPCNLISLLKPEFHVKGGDYVESELPEYKIIKEYGGKVVIIPLVPGRSTTQIAKRIRGE